MVISICNEKGGCGKTTLALNIAGRLAEDGDEVLLIDADPQNSTNVFTETRYEKDLKKLFSNVSVKGANSLQNEIKAMEEKFDCLVIDTGGRDSVEMRKAFLLSNIVIMPIVPSSLDENVFKSVVEIFRGAIQFNSDMIALIVPNRVTTNPFIGNKEIEDLRKFISDIKEGDEDLERLILLDSVISERKTYRDSIRVGKSLKEFLSIKNDKNTQIEFESFFEEIVAKSKELILGYNLVNEIKIFSCV